MNTPLGHVLRTSIVCCFWISSWWGAPPPARWWCRRGGAFGRWAPRPPGSDPPRHLTTGPTTAQTSWSKDPEKCRTVSSPTEILALHEVKCGISLINRFAQLQHYLFCLLVLIQAVLVWFLLLLPFSTARGAPFWVLGVFTTSDVYKWSESSRANRLFACWTHSQSY